MKAVQISRFGGPEVLEYVDVADPEPGPGQFVVEVDGAGVNYADTHQAENSYLSPVTLPLIPGSEVIGRSADGRRWCGLTTSGYAERAVLTAGQAFEVPANISDTAALALLVQGLTAYHLVKTSGRVSAGESVVVHAAAGGVGSLAIQLARQAGAGKIIATASTEDKRALAVSLGADVAVDPATESLAAALREANDGKRVDVVFEMTGGHVFDESLRALGRFGRLVTFGQASREEPTPLRPGALTIGSRSVIGFWLVDALAPEHAAAMAVAPLRDLVSLTESGQLRHLPGHTYPLDHATQAHVDLRARRTAGKVVLAPRREAAS